MKMFLLKHGLCMAITVESAGVFIELDIF